MKKIFILIALFFFGSPLFAPTHVYLTNNTPYILTIKSDYSGGTLVENAFWKNPITTINPGEKIELIHFLRKKTLKPGTTYLFTTRVSLPNKLPSFKLLEQELMTLDSTSEHRSKIWAAILPPKQKEPEWVPLEKPQIQEWTDKDKKITFKCILKWSEGLNEDLYHDLFYEISSE